MTWDNEPSTDTIPTRWVGSNYIVNESAPGISSDPESFFRGMLNRQRYLRTTDVTDDTISMDRSGVMRLVEDNPNLRYYYLGYSNNEGEPMFSVERSSIMRQNGVRYTDVTCNQCHNHIRVATPDAPLSVISPELPEGVDLGEYALQCKHDMEKSQKDLKLMQEKIQFLDNLLLECDDDQVSEQIIEWRLKH